MTDSLENEMTRAVDRLNDRGVPPAIRIPASDETTVGAKLLEATEHSRAINLEVAPPLATLKRLLRRFLRSVLGRQSAYNEAMLNAVSELNHQLMLVRHEIVDIRTEVEQHRRSVAVHLATIETQVDDIRHDDLVNISCQLAELAAKSVMQSPYDEQVYAAFDDALGGPPPSIAERLGPYLTDLADLKGGALPVVDLGTGRGEWLRILREAEIPAVGFDTNERFADEARADGLDVEIGDAIDLLAARPPGSLAAVTAFQLIEQLTARDISRLIEAAFVALVPGGALILETPNASNLRVGASAFYRDPRHLRPIHPDWLSFLVGHQGFVGVETRFLHPDARYDEFPTSVGEGTPPAEPLLADLRWALYGPQDFAIVARKPRPPAA